MGIRGDSRGFVGILTKFNHLSLSPLFLRTRVSLRGFEFRRRDENLWSIDTFIIHQSLSEVGGALKIDQ